MNINGNMNFRLVEGGDKGYTIHSYPTGAFSFSYTETNDPNVAQLAKSDVRNAWMGIIGFNASKSWTGYFI